MRYADSMPEYRRAIQPGAAFFFPLLTEGREPLLVEPAARRLLGMAFAHTRERFPFTVNAIVLLPDHLHTIWTLVTDDADFSTRWPFPKRHFTKAWLVRGGREQPTSRSRHRNRRRGVWQRRFLGARDSRRGGLHSALRLHPLQSGQARLGALSARLAMLVLSSLRAAAHLRVRLGVWLRQGIDTGAGLQRYRNDRDGVATVRTADPTLAAHTSRGAKGCSHRTTKHLRRYRGVSAYSVSAK